MHIIHLVTRLLRAGSEENTIETCKWQVKAGHKVTLIHGRDADPWWQDNPVAGVDLLGLPQMVHPLDPLADMRALRALRTAYRRLQPDVIHTHQSKAGILGRLAATVVPDAVVAHTIHIVPFEGVSRAKQAFYIGAEKLAARRTDVFIGVSEAVGHAYVTAGITRRGRVHCVRSGIDLARFRNAALPDDWRALLGVKHGNARPRVALMLAAFEPRKRHVEFLQAFARAAGTLPDLKLLLAGAGPEEARVRAEVQRLGLQDAVVFCGHRADPEALLALADVSLLTSEREGLPRVVVQSIAAGCPVLVNDMPGIGEVIRDGTNGHIAPRGSLDGIVAQLRSVLANDVGLKRLSTGALATDVDPWSLTSMGARTTTLYGLPAQAQSAMRAA
ncbi:MAG: glycosyltransferase family 1 protein [Alphaproteobacteria bacterium]|nr:MAG: glycosyltransferase family 1 protein [Alphaproteobacteria bacterium]